MPYFCLLLYDGYLHAAIMACAMKSVVTQIFSGTDMRLLVLPVVFLFEVHRCFVSSVMECVITAAFLCWAQQGPTHLLQAGGQAQAPGGEDEE